MTAIAGMVGKCVGRKTAAPPVLQASSHRSHLLSCAKRQRCPRHLPVVLVKALLAVVAGDKDDLERLACAFARWAAERGIAHDACAWLCAVGH
eukprot:357108-Chlamydomonas_euryale.AAC.5